jgi:hypothetical protein
VNNGVDRPHRGYAPHQMAEEEHAGAVTEGLPPYVLTDADRARWENAGRVARDVLADDTTPEALWAMTRTIFHDRETYPD